MVPKMIGLPGLLLFLLFCVLFSCRRENISGPRTLADSTALFSASINGMDWHTDSVSGFLSCEYGGAVRIMTITGYTANRVISISLRDTTTVGSNDSTLSPLTYNVGDFGNAVFGYAFNPILLGRNLIWQQKGTARSGLATVTASDGVNKRVSGKFQFTARLVVVDSTGGGLRADTVSITNGMFSNIPYTYFRHP